MPPLKRVTGHLVCSGQHLLYVAYGIWEALSGRVASPQRRISTKEADDDEQAGLKPPIRVLSSSSYNKYTVWEFSKLNSAPCSVLGNSLEYSVASIPLHAFRDTEYVYILAPRTLMSDASARG